MSNQSGQNDHGWHVSREISVSHIITTVAAIVSFGYWLTTVESRVTLLERQDTFLAAQDNELRSRIEANSAQNRLYYEDIKRAIQRIEDKLDQKADKDDRR